MSPSQPSWKAGYLELLAEEGGDFSVLASPPPDARPLLIWVHPGDAVDDREAFDTREGYERSVSHQRQMAVEIMDRMSDHQVVVLHRFSSDWAFEKKRAQPTYREAMAAVTQDPTTVVLFGDDLPEVSDWLLAHQNVLGRPSVFMTGAWSDPEYGCVTTVGKGLEAGGVRGIQLSAWSPSEPGSVKGQWQPQPSLVLQNVPAPEEDRSIRQRSRRRQP